MNPSVRVSGEAAAGTEVSTFYAVVTILSLPLNVSVQYATSLLSEE